MASVKQLYIAGLENHLALVSKQRELELLGRLLLDEPNRVVNSVTGNEDWEDHFVDGMKSLGSGLLTASKWVGGKTIDTFGKVLGLAGNELDKAFSDNDVLIKKILQGFSKIEEHVLNLSKTTVILLTTDGNIEHVSHGMDQLIHAMDSLDKHSKDVLDYLDKQLIIARKLKSVATAETIFTVVDEFRDVKYPAFDLPHSKGDSHTSDVLPGGKVWEFNCTGGKAPKYIIGGDAPAEAGSSVTWSKSEVSALLNKLSKVNSMHVRLKQAYDNYLSYLKSWAEMVKTVDANLSKLDKVSGSAMAEAEKILAGEPNALAFYSGFTPRVVSYTDRYIHGVLGVFA